MALYYLNLDYKEKIIELLYYKMKVDINQFSIFHIIFKITIWDAKR